MTRSPHSLVAVVATAVFLAVGGTLAANETFPFNSSAEGWTFGTLPPPSGTLTPTWDWYGTPSSQSGGLQAYVVDSGSFAGAWAMSPCLDIRQNPGEEFVHVDFAHFTEFPVDVLGQVQFRVDATGTSGFGGWQGIPTAYWFTTGHLAPNEPNVFSPLLTSTGSNDWLAFSGTNNGDTVPDADAGAGTHVLSAFDLPWAPNGLSNASQIQFRFVVGVENGVTTQSPPKLLWEVDRVQINGVKVCVVPEPGALALAGVAVVCGLGGIARRSMGGQRRRREPRQRSPAPDRGRR